MAKLKAYSLIEMAVALAIAAVVSAAALSMYATLVGSMYGLRAQSSVDTRLQRIGRAFAGDLQEIGGGAIRPWHALLVQPNVGGPDGLLMLTAETQSRPCTVDEFEHGEIEVGGACPMCAGTTAGIEQEYYGRFAVLSQPGGVGTVVAIKSPDGLGGGGCEVKADRVVDDMGRGADFSGASLTVVNAKWIFVEPTTHELRAWMLYSTASAPAEARAPTAGLGPRSFTANYSVDERVLATDIYDFEVALGYDVDFNNVVVDSVSGANDEWFGNLAGELPVTDWIGDEPTEFDSALVLDPSHDVEQIRLRSVNVGFVMGVKARGVARPPVQVFDGPSFSDTNMYYRRANAVAMFRNAGATQ